MHVTNPTTERLEADSAAPWLASYPAGVPREIKLEGGPSTLKELLEDSFQRFSERAMFSFMGTELTYAAVDSLSLKLGVYLQGLGLESGDRVAVMLPNIPQYPIVVAAILRAGYVLVNVNPLYTARELEHQLKDSQARAIVIHEAAGATLQECIESTNVSDVIICAFDDMLPEPKQATPKVSDLKLRNAIRYPEALRRMVGQSLRPVVVKPDDIALLQYTGGTTGASKGAVLLHRNLVANALQFEAWVQPAWGKVPASEQPTLACVLPLYHILAFTVNFVAAARAGSLNVLIPDPRNVKAALKELGRHRIHFFPGLNTLFLTYMNDPEFARVDWSHLRLTMAGGMTTQPGVQNQWKQRTGCGICEGFGMSETAGTVTSNLPTGEKVCEGIGLPIPSTEVAILDDDGELVPVGEIGELAIRGPQVFAGYWSQGQIVPACDEQGFFRTGDLGYMQPDGHFRIVDRKKDMVLVNGFNVYPAEIEAFVSTCPGVQECAVVGIPDPHSGEAIKLVIVRQDQALTEDIIRSHCRKGLTGYKQPSKIEFVTSLPKSAVGKILRKDLR